MGREATISYEQAAAAATMKAAGSKPTSRAIRERIGNIGSMGTIVSDPQTPVIAIDRNLRTGARFGR